VISLGMPIVINDLIPADIERQYQTRRHRRSRVNKKWLKRYGMTTTYKPASYMYDGTLIVNTPMMNKLKAALPNPEANHE
jgi:hypothetical protein